MFKKNKNYKVLFGIIVGVVLSATVVGAATYYGTASELSYNNTTSGLKSSNVQDALDELYETATSCPDDNYCIETSLHLGDYVLYTPAATSYTTDISKTGYTSSTQIINPSELTLWRVLNINDDGTVDIISEYVSSTDVYFKGQTGYLNLVGYLNELASQYVSTFATGARHFGYNRYKSQTQYITDTSQFTTTAPWTSSTSDNSNEAQGGGDTLYLEDYNKVIAVLGTAKAYKVGTTTATAYWMASRYYYYSSSSSLNFYGRNVNAGGFSSSGPLYTRTSDVFFSQNGGYALRPIVTLKSGIRYTGDGTVATPWQIRVY